LVHINKDVLRHKFELWAASGAGSGFWILNSDLDKDGEDEGFGCQADAGSVSGAGEMRLDDGAVLVVAIVTRWGW